jgi:hypothetical protein
MVRLLSVVDLYAHECLTLEAYTNLGSGRTTSDAGAADRLDES